MTVKVYTPNQVLLGAFLGGPFVSLFTLSRNYKALEKNRERIITLLTCLAGISLLAVLMSRVGDLGEFFTLSAVIAIAYSGFSAYFVKKYQMTDELKLKLASNKASVISMIFLVVASLLIFIIYSSAISLVIYKIQNPEYSFTSEYESALYKYNVKNGEYDINAHHRIEIKFRDGDVLSKENLDILTELTSETWRLPNTKRVTSLSNAIVINALEKNNDFSVGFLGDKFPDFTPEKSNEIDEFITAEYGLVDRLYFPQSNTVVIELESEIQEGTGERSIFDFLVVIRAFEVSFESKYPIDIELSGSYLDSTLKNYEFYSLPVSYNKDVELYSSELVNDLNAFSEWMRTQEGVSYAWSVGDVVKQLVRVMTGKQVEGISINEPAMILNQYVLLYEISLAYGFDISHLVNKNEEKIYIDLRLRSDDKDDIQALIDKSHIWLLSNTSGRLYIDTDDSVVQ